MAGAAADEYNCDRKDAPSVFKPEPQFWGVGGLHPAAGGKKDNAFPCPPLRPAEDFLFSLVQLSTGDNLVTHS